MCSESRAPALQRGGGCRLPAEMAPACGDWCHWPPHRDLQQGEEHVHQWSNFQTTRKQQASWKSILQVAQFFEVQLFTPEGLIPESNFGDLFPYELWF